MRVLVNRLPIAALLWSSILLALCAVIGGAAENVMFPTAVTCAPFPVGYGPSLGAFAIPLALVFWFFVARAAVRGKPWLCPTLLAFHYVLAIVGLAFVLPDDLRDANRSPRQILAAAAAGLIAWGVIYFAGQVTIWWAWAQSVRRRNGDYHRGAPWPSHSKPKSIAKRPSPKRARA